MDKTQGLDLDPMGTFRLSRLRPKYSAWMGDYQWEYLGEPGIFNQPFWNPRTCPCGGLRAGQLVLAHSSCSPLKRGNNLEGLSNCRDLCFGITYGLD